MGIDRFRSSYINISTGVPQGSILGPLLFIICINDLPNAISRLFKCIIYADDPTLIANLNEFYAKHDSGLNINILNLAPLCRSLSLSIGFKRFPLTPLHHALFPTCHLSTPTQLALTSL